MRNITHTASRALFNDGSMKRDNTEVIGTMNAGYKYSTMYLHSHPVALYYESANIFRISNCAYMTNTTKERLNGVLHHAHLNGLIPQLYIYQRDFDWYISNYHHSIRWSYLTKYGDLNSIRDSTYIDSRDLLREFVF